MFNAAKRKRPFKAIGASAKGGASTATNSNNDNNNNGGLTKTSIIKATKVSTPPTTIEINNIEVHFPFRPYGVQHDYMKSVLTALQNSQHALLESPTGTGKTLCLLCSALAWQRQEKGRIAQRQNNDDPSMQLSQQQKLQSNLNNANDDDVAPPPTTNKPPIIIYASRTHSQLSQVVGELRNTRYRPRHAVLGSREHTCIHPKVNPLIAKGKSNSSDADQIKSSTEVNNGCNKLQKGRKCLYRNNLEDKSGKGECWKPPTKDKQAAGADYEQPVLDMEDLVTIGRQHKVCPFYHTRSLLKDAELIFVPYNYLFDRDARETTLAEVDFANAVLIFDEAHNLEEFASESASFDLGSGDVASCVNEVQRALQYLELNPDMGEGSSGGGGMKDNMLRLKTILLKFEKYLDEGITTNSKSGGGAKLGKEGEASHPGEFIFDVFREGAGINHENLKLFVDFVKRVQDVIGEFNGNASSSGTPKLDHFLACLKRAFGPAREGADTTKSQLLAIARAKSYRVHVTKMTGNNNKNGGGGFKGGRTISYWCFAPALAMRELSFLKVRSILITSGTLAPLPSFSMELGLDFPVQLENNHVIQSDQIFVRVVGKGVSGKELSSKFGRRDDPEYISELGNTLASLCRNIPGGVLVFFPSYSAMQTAIERWGGPASERFGGGRQSGGGGRGAAFFAAKRKKAASAKYVFPIVPPSFRPTNPGESSPWKRLLARKSVVLEPRSTKDLSEAITEYKKLLSMPKSTGAILMGVCRGKISEGIDFSDDMCRAVVVTGLPFAPYMDPKVKLKREFLDAARASSKARPSVDGGFGSGSFGGKASRVVGTQHTTLSGGEWYNQQAHRAVNQAIGRVIRHRHDYGAVLLLDHRFAQVSNRDGLSKWVRPHLRDETFGSSTRGLVKFYKESKAKATERVKKDNPPVIKYENNYDEDKDITKLSVVTMGGVKDRGLAKDDALLNGYVQPNRVIKRYDLNDPPSAVKSEEIPGVDFDVAEDVDSSEEPSGTGLGALYNKGKAKPLLTPPSTGKKTSSFGNIERMRRTDDIPKFGFAKKDPLKRRPQPGRKSDAAKLQAKIFFEKAQVALCPQDLMKVQKLLVAMKGYGDSKNELQYIKAAKELISVLVESQVDATRIQLISTLFPLLPMKYQYKIEKMAASLAFDKSPLRSRCKDALSEEEFPKVQSFVLSMIFSQSSPRNSTAFTDRELLEDSQKILTILVKNDVNLQCFFDLLPQQVLRRVRTLALEMKRSRDVAKARERSSNFKGDNCVNTTLFRRPDQKPLAVRDNGGSEPLEDTPDAESEKHMTEALSQAMGVHRQRRDRVMDFQKKTESKPKTFNPYRRPASQQSTKRNMPAVVNGSVHAATSKRVRVGLGDNATSRAVPQRSARPKSLDMVDRCLQQVKSDGFVQSKTRLQRINGKINAHVPKGMLCVVCSETPKEPLMAECHHTACLHCWKSWLKRKNTCPTCRAPTTMKDLSKLVFARGTATGAPSLTQICASEDEDEESGNEELEIIAN